MTDFQQWFAASWRKPNESEYQASVRLAGAAEVSVPTARKAVQGRPVGSDVAPRLAALADCHPWALVCPENAEVSDDS